MIKSLSHKSKNKRPISILFMQAAIFYSIVIPKKITTYFGINIEMDGNQKNT